MFSPTLVLQGKYMNLNTLNKTELDQRIKNLAQKERHLLHEILLTIKEIDSRRTYLDLGFGSLHDYLVQGVGYSEGSAQRRIDAARLIKELPQIAEKIQSGEIKLNQISLVQKAAREVYKTHAQKVGAEHKLVLLEQLTHKNHSESQQQVAAFFDLPVLFGQVKKTQADESVRLELTLSKEAYAKLKQAQDLLAHAVPTQDLAVLLEYLADKVIKQKLGTGPKNKPKAVSPASAAAPETTATVAVKALSLAVKKQVLNDQKCCQYKDALTGKICGSTWLAQVDHKQAKWAKGSDEILHLQPAVSQYQLYYILINVVFWKKKKNFLIFEFVFFFCFFFVFWRDPVTSAA